MRVLALSLALILPVPALANDAQRIETRAAFLSLVQDRALTRFGITLNVGPDGRITGRGFGMDVTGEWSWRDGFFCRTLAFGSRAEPLNCQVVERRGSTLRFTADKGAGDYADLRIR